MNGAPGREKSLQSLLRKLSVGKWFFSRSSSANGFTVPVGWLPALNAANWPFPSELRITSAMILRAELPVQRKSTLNGPRSMTKLHQAQHALGLVDSVELQPPAWSVRSGLP